MNLRIDKPIEPTEYTSIPYGEVCLFGGLVSDYGIEDIFSKETLTPEKVDYMSLRSRMNPHRNLRIFVCSIKKKYVKDFTKIEPTKLYELLKKISIQFKED